MTITPVAAGGRNAWCRSRVSNTRLSSRFLVGQTFAIDEGRVIRAASTVANDGSLLPRVGRRGLRPVLAQPYLLLWTNCEESRRVVVPSRRTHG